MQLLSHHIEFTLDASQNELARWFDEHVRPVDASRLDKREFVGELTESHFWLQPKPQFRVRNEANLFLKEWNRATGTYRIKGNDLSIRLTVALTTSIRSWLLTGTILWLLAGSFLIQLSKTRDILAFGIFSLTFLAAAIWRVRQDAQDYKDILSKQPENKSTRR